MEENDLTIEILKQIRDNTGTNSERIAETNQRLDETNRRLDETNTRLDETNTRLVGMELRLATELTSVAGLLKTVIEGQQDQRNLAGRVERCEQDIAAIKSAL